MNSQPIHVRLAMPADLDTLVTFNRAMAIETEKKTLDSQTVEAGVRRALEDPSRCRYFVAELEGTIAGQTMVTFEWSDWRNGFFWWIQSVYVDPRFRRSGVFRALHEHIRTMARSQREVCGLRLYVHQENRRAIDTYSVLGMDVTDYRLCEEDWSQGRG